MSLEINKRITECRKKAKIKKTEMADRLGMKYTTYCRMEEKAKRITNDVIEKIAEILGVDKDYILYGPKEEYDFTPLDHKKLVVDSPNRNVSPFETAEAPIVKFSHGEFVCTSEEKALVLIYRSLGSDKKQAIRELIDSFDK